MTVPLAIDTERLTLRQFAPDDWRAMHEHYCDVECTRFTFGRALTEGESWRAVASMLGHWQLRGYGPYAVVENVSSAVLGTVGLWYPNDWPEPEIKWALLRKAWGKGYAQEAARAVQGMAVRELGSPPISLIGVDNVASINVALAVGAKLERQLLFRGNPFSIYRHPDVRCGEA
jgi:RimJ/RimL family protein N-acetyltransferase